jgi:16S rRNA processing protein RimM
MMRAIIKDDCTPIGYLQKTHGLDGSFSMHFEEQLDLTLEEAEYLFLEIDGGLVPFFISDEGFRFRGNDGAIIHFDEIESQGQAREFTGCPVWIFTDEIIEPEEDNTPPLLIGYDVVDQKHGLLGKVTNVDDYSGNLVITVIFRENEVLIPLSEDVLTEMDETNRQLKLICPDGLIELYLE